jgi:hypothetical protein
LRLLTNVLSRAYQIIGYLDLRVNELEGQQAEYAMRCQQLQASLDLQFGSHSHKVRRAAVFVAVGAWGF